MLSSGAAIGCQRESAPAIVSHVLGLDVHIDSLWPVALPAGEAGPSGHEAVHCAERAELLIPETDTLVTAGPGGAPSTTGHPGDAQCHHSVIREHQLSLLNKLPRHSVADKGTFNLVMLVRSSAIRSGNSW